MHGYALGEMDWAPLLLSAALVTASSAATVHVLLNKEEPRAAVGWIGLLWFAPVAGIALYVVFGINRIQRKALKLRGDHAPLDAARSLEASSGPDDDLDDDLVGLEPLAHLGRELTGRPLTAGNRVQLLESGDEAYPRWLEDLRGATRSITLLSYIFDRDDVGMQFVDALGEAVERGVEVRVLVDALGARYSLPTTILPALRRRGVPAARFLPARPLSVAFLNLRNHRKVCVIDGRIAYTGGLNIRKWHVLQLSGDRGTRDLHARVEGPVAAQLQQAFVEDWAFATGEVLQGDLWFPELAEVGDVHARAIPDGPDGTLGAARLTFLGGLAVARRSVRIVTPYFLPEEALGAALVNASLRGVQVDVLVPARPAPAYVHWASAVDVAHLVERGVRVWASPLPFDHTKLMVVDGRWAIVGSANWDPRSLRLNFELLLELYDEEVAAAAEAAVDDRIGRARPVTPADLARRSVWTRLRDHTMRLLKPYL